MDCPNLTTCPFPDMKCNVSDDLWKVLYCYSNSIYGFANCSRYLYKEEHQEKPPADLLPNT